MQNFQEMKMEIHTTFVNTLVEDVIESDSLKHIIKQLKNIIAQIHLLPCMDDDKEFKSTSGCKTHSLKHFLKKEYSFFDDQTLKKSVDRILYILNDVQNMLYFLKEQIKNAPLNIGRENNMPIIMCLFFPDLNHEYDWQSFEKYEKSFQKIVSHLGQVQWHVYVNYYTNKCRECSSDVLEKKYDKIKDVFTSVQEFVESNDFNQVMKPIKVYSSGLNTALNAVEHFEMLAKNIEMIESSLDEFTEEEQHECAVCKSSSDESFASVSALPCKHLVLCIACAKLTLDKSVGSFKQALQNRDSNDDSSFDESEWKNVLKCPICRSDVESFACHNKEHYFPTKRIHDDDDLVDISTNKKARSEN